MLSHGVSLARRCGKQGDKMIPQAPAQLSLPLDMSVIQQHRTLKECIAARVYVQRGGLSAVAGRLDMSPSHLSEILGGGRGSQPQARRRGAGALHADHGRPHAAALVERDVPGERGGSAATRAGTDRTVRGARARTSRGCRHHEGARPVTFSPSQFAANSPPRLILQPPFCLSAESR